MSINYVLNCEKNSLINNISKKLAKFIKNLDAIEKEFSEYIPTFGKYVNIQIKIYEFNFVKFVNIFIDSNGKKILFDGIIKNKKINFIIEDTYINGMNTNYIENDLMYQNISIYSIFSFNEVLFFHNEDNLYGYIKNKNSIFYVFTDKENFSFIESDFEGNLIKSKKFKFNNIEKIEHLIIYLSNHLEIKEDFLSKLDELGLLKINKEFFKINEIINY